MHYIRTRIQNSLRAGDHHHGPQDVDAILISHKYVGRETCARAHAREPAKCVNRTVNNYTFAEIVNDGRSPALSGVARVQH